MVAPSPSFSLDRPIATMRNRLFCFKASLTESKSSRAYIAVAFALVSPGTLPILSRERPGRGERIAAPCDASCDGSGAALAFIGGEGSARTRQRRGGRRGRVARFSAGHLRRRRALRAAPPRAADPGTACTPSDRPRRLSPTRTSRSAMPSVRLSDDARSGSAARGRA